MSSGHAVRRALALLVLAPTVVMAEPDLRVRDLPDVRPARLAMRPNVAAVTPAATPAAADDTGVAATTAFTPVPTSRRDVADRLIVKLRAGYELDGASASGDPLRGGAALSAGFSGSRQWIVGDAVVGARDLLVPSLGAYLLSSFQLESTETLAAQTALAVPGDATDQRIAIKAGYAEWGRDDRRPNQKLWLRGGRQFRLDGGALFAYFDGATIGYRETAWNASAFAGQRVALYVETERGVLYGATAALDLKRAKDWPLEIAVDYLGLMLEAERRGMLAITATSEPHDRTQLAIRARIIEDAAGVSFGRIGGRLRLTATDKLLLIADVEQRFGGDLAYDIAAPSAVDVVNVARQLGVGLAAPIDALTVGARVDYRRNVTELLIFTRAELPQRTATTVDQQGWIEGGAALAAQPSTGVWAIGQYTLREYQLDEAANAMGTRFGDTSGSGLDRLHELAVDVTMRSQRGVGADRNARWRFSAGAFYRIYDRRTPYALTVHEGRGGARADLRRWITRNFHVEVGGEVAQPSPVLARELGTLTSLRAALEARW